MVDSRQPTIGRQVVDSDNRLEVANKGLCVTNNKHWEADGKWWIAGGRGQMMGGRC